MTVRVFRVHPEQSVQRVLRLVRLVRLDLSKKAIGRSVPFAPTELMKMATERRVCLAHLAHGRIAVRPSARFVRAAHEH